MTTTSASVEFDPKTYWDGTWKAGYTSIVNNYTLAQSGYLAYDAATGEAETGTLLPLADEGYRRSWQGKWHPGWTALAPYNSDLGRCLLSYKAGDGKLSLDLFESNGHDFKNLAALQWPTGLTSVVILAGADVRYVLAYNAKTGQAGLARLRPNGDGLTYMWADKWVTWTTGWTSFVVLYSGGSKYLVSHKAGDGTLSVDLFTGDRFVNKYKSAAWATEPKDWSSFAPLYSSGYLAYKTKDGQARLDLLDSDGAGVTNQWADQWTTGWTTFMPFLYSAGDEDYKTTFPYFLSYKKQSGRVTLDCYDIGTLAEG